MSSTFFKSINNHNDNSNRFGIGTEERVGQCCLRYKQYDKIILESMVGRLLSNDNIRNNKENIEIVESCIAMSSI